MKECFSEPKHYQWTVIFSVCFTIRVKNILMVIGENRTLHISIDLLSHRARNPAWRRGWKRNQRETTSCSGHPGNGIGSPRLRDSLVQKPIFLPYEDYNKDLKISLTPDFLLPVLANSPPLSGTGPQGQAGLSKDYTEVPLHSLNLKAKEMLLSPQHTGEWGLIGVGDGGVREVVSGIVENWTACW